MGSILGPCSTITIHTAFHVVNFTSNKTDVLEFVTLCGQGKVGRGREDSSNTNKP